MSENISIFLNEITHTSFNNTVYSHQFISIISIIRILIIRGELILPKAQVPAPAPTPTSAYTDENVSCCNAGSGANPGTGTGTGEFIYPVDI